MTLQITRTESAAESSPMNAAGMRKYTISGLKLELIYITIIAIRQFLTSVRAMKWQISIIRNISM